MKSNEATQAEAYNTISHKQQSSKTEIQGHRQPSNPGRLDSNPNQQPHQARDLLEETIANLTVSVNEGSANLLKENQCRQTQNQMLLHSKKANSILMPTVKQKLNSNQSNILKKEKSLSKSKAPTYRESNTTARRVSNTSASEIGSLAGVMQSNLNSMINLNETGKQILSPGKYNANYKGHPLQKKTINNSSLQLIKKPKFVNKQYFSSLPQRDHQQTRVNSINQDFITNAGVDDFGHNPGMHLGNLNRPYGASIQKTSPGLRLIEQSSDDPIRRFGPGDKYIDDNNKYTDFLANSQMAMLDQESNQLVPVGSKTFFAKNNSSSILSTNSQTQKNLAVYQNSGNKQNKTRNNLQQHVISQNPNGKVQAVIGEPYMAQRNLAQSTLSSKTQRNNESVEWKQSIFAKKQIIQIKQSKQEPPQLNTRTNQDSSEWLETINNQTSARSRHPDQTGNSFNISIRDNNTHAFLGNGHSSNLKQQKQRGKQNASEVKYPALPHQLTNAYASSKQSLTHTQKSKTGKTPIPGLGVDLGQVIESSGKKLMMPQLFSNNGMDGKSTQPSKSKPKNVQPETQGQTKNHNHTNSSISASTIWLPGSNNQVATPSKKELQGLKRLSSPPRNKDDDFAGNVPTRKTHTEFPISEVGTHRQSYFQSHFTVTKDDNENSNEDRNEPGVTSDTYSTSQTQMNSSQKRLRRLTNDTKTQREKKFNLNIDQNRWQLERKRHDLLYGTINSNQVGYNVSNSKAMRKKRLQDAYMNGSSKNLSPERIRNNSNSTNTIKSHGVYTGNGVYAGPHSTVSHKLETSNNNIRILGETPNHASETNNSIPITPSTRLQQATAKQHPGFQSQQLKNFAIKESVKLEPVLGKSNNVQSQILVTESSEIQQINKTSLIAGSSSRDLISTSTLLIHKEEMGLGNSIESQKLWKNSQIQQGRTVKQNVARNQSIQSFPIHGRGNDKIHEQFPSIKNTKNSKNMKPQSKKINPLSTGQNKHNILTNSQSPTNVQLVKRDYSNQYRDKQLINSSRVVNINNASQSMAPPSKINTMEHFHNHSHVSTFIRQSFNQSGVEIRDQEMIGGAESTVEKELQQQRDQNEYRRSITDKQVSNVFSHTKSPRSKKSSMLNTNSMTSLPKIESKKDLLHQQSNGGREKGRRISQRIEGEKLSNLSNNKSTPRKQNIIKVSKLSNTRQSLKQQFNIPQNFVAHQSSLKSKDASSAFNSPKIKKQVTMKDEHELISLQSKILQEDDNGSLGLQDSAHRKKSPIVLKEDVDCEEKHENSKKGATEELKQSNASVTESFKSQSQSSITEAKAALLLAESNHQIRIEIGKQEVLENMKPDYENQLSLLYYDFNNSTARLVSKQKKLSDFVIQEEAEEQNAAGKSASKFDSPLRKTPPSPTIGGPRKQKLNHSNSSHLRVNSPGIVQTSIDSDANQSDFERVNRKISKAKLSIGQLQQDGIGMGLQSPARLANSRNSINSDKGSKKLSASGAQEEKILISPTNQGQKALFMFNSKGGKTNNLAVNRNNSPFFGAGSKVKNTQPQNITDKPNQVVSQNENSLQQDSLMSQHDGTMMSNNSGGGIQAAQNGGGTGATELGANFATLVNQHSLQSNERSAREENKGKYGGGTGILPMTGDRVSTNNAQNHNNSSQLLDGNEESASQHWNGEAGESFDNTKSQGDTFQSVLQFVKENPTIWQ